jgi:hypothetical protein
MGEEDIEGVTLGGDRAVERIGEPGSERSSALAKLFETGELLDLEEIAGPSLWPDLSADEAAREWPALRSWVERLMARFPHLDHHVIPRCWFLHNGHVEALAALRDQERINYGETAPGTAAVDWHRAFRDIEARLREWTGQLACGANHESRLRAAHIIDPDEWERFVSNDTLQRDQCDVTRGLGEEGPSVVPDRATV